MKGYTVTLSRWIEAEDPAEAAQTFIDETVDNSDFGWIVSVDNADGVRRRFDVVAGDNASRYVSYSQLVRCCCCGGDVEE